MESCDVKKALKEAKDAVKNKEYQAALDHCKLILKTDKTSYLGWVLSAVSFQELGQPDKALTAFNRAVELQPNQLTAWQGLAAFLEQERNTVSTDIDVKLVQEKIARLQEAYSKLIEFYKGEPQKLVTVLRKQCTLYADTKDWENCARAAEQLVMSDSTQDTLQLVLNLIFKQETLPGPLVNIAETAVLKLMETNPENQLVLRKRLLSIKLIQGKYSDCVSLAEEILKLDASNVEALELLCRVFVLEPSCNVSVEQATAAAEKLLSLSSNTLYANLAKGAIFLKKGSLWDARNLLQQVSARNESLPCLELLCETYFKLRQWNKVEEVCTSAMKKTAITKWKEYFLRALLEQQDDEKLNAALEVWNTFTKEEQESPLLNILRARCLVRRGNFDFAESLLQNSKDSIMSADLASLKIEILLEQKNEERAVNLIEQLESELSNEVDFCVFAAKTLWDLKRCEKSVELYRRALKLNSFLKEPYFFLGVYYGDSDLAEQNQFAVKSLQLALQLDPSCLRTAETLSDLYLKLRDTEGNLKLLKSLTDRFSPKEAKWVWLRKGLVDLEQARNSDNEIEREKMASEAIFCFQNILRADPADQCCWEALGDGYSSRGSYSSALKAYQKALTLNGNSTYASYQIAVVQHSLGETEDSINSYKALLIKNPKYVPALKGLADTLLVEARSHQENGFTGRLLDNCSEALSLLVTAAQLRPQFASLWALMGQSCLMLDTIPESQFDFVVPALLGENNAAEGTSAVSKAQTMGLGKQFYLRALQLSPENSSLWHNLALCYKVCAGTCPSQEVDSNLAAALSAAKKAVSLNPTNEEHWNLLGVVASHPSFEQPELAQHSFIRAIEHNGTSASAWTNLGVLYFKHDHLHLAHEALKKSQNVDPFYVRAWIGQAHIAEQLNPVEAMDLFRHTVSIGTGSYGEIEGSVAYAQWVINTLLDPTEKNTPHYRYSIVQMHAVTTAIDALVKYIAIFPEDACALNLLGLLYERQGLYRNAEAAFSSAKKLLESSPTAKKELQKVQANLARIYTATERPNQATELYASLQDSELSTACGVALAHFKAGRFAEAFVTYQATLDWLAPDDAIRSHLHVALASCAFRRDCRQAEAATTLLFQSSQMEPASVYGLLALASLGLLTEDSALVEAAFQEILPYVTEKRYSTDIAFLFAYYRLISTDSQAALKELARYCHMLPTLSKMWMQMATFLGTATIAASQTWKAQPSDGEKVARYAEIAAGVARHVGSNADDEVLDIAQVEAVTGMGYLLAGDERKSMVAAQKAVHCSPNSAAPWSVLLAASCFSWKSSGCLDKHRTLWLKQLIGHLRRNCDVAAFSGLAPWLGGYEKRLTSLMGVA